MSYSAFSPIRKHVLVIGTGQHVGKTTASLGLVDTLLRRLRSRPLPTSSIPTSKQNAYGILGYCKPVGQKYVSVKVDTPPISATNNENNKEGGEVKSQMIEVDKDTYLFRDYFHLTHDYHDMSPVHFPRNFTRDYLDEKFTSQGLIEKIHQSFDNLSKKSEFIVLEGTGHTGVGSICEVNNAQVAEALGLDVICVVEGGIGSSFDKLALNREMLLHYQVKLKGVIVNHVEPSKLKMVEEYYRKALKRWNIPLLGVVPENDILKSPTMDDYSKLLDCEILSGQNDAKVRYFNSTRLVLAAIDQRNIFKPIMNQLVITHTSRTDVLNAMITNQQIYREKGTNLETGIIVAGWERPNDNILKRLQRENIPCIYVPGSKMDSFHLLKKICSYTAKLKREDVNRIQTAIQHVNKYVNFDIIELENEKRNS